jgi:hypothetical protein
VSWTWRLRGLTRVADVDAGLAVPTA